MSKMNAQIAIPYITTLEDEDFPVAELTESEIIPVMEKALSDLCSKNSLMYGIILGDPELNEIPVSTWFTNFYEAEYNLRNGVSQKDDFRIIENKLSEYLINISINDTLDDSEENMAFLSEGFIDIKLGKSINKRIYRISYKLVDSNAEEALFYIENNLQALTNDADNDENHTDTPPRIH